MSFSWCPLLLVLSLCDKELNLAPYVLHTPCRYISTLMRFPLSFIQTKQFQFSQPFLVFEVLQSCHHLSALVLGMFQEVYIFSFNVGPKTRHNSPDTTSPCWIKTKYHFPWDAGTAVMIMLSCKAILLAHIKFCVHQDPQVFLRKVAFQTVCPQSIPLSAMVPPQIQNFPFPFLELLRSSPQNLPNESLKWLKTAESPEISQFDLLPAFKISNSMVTASKSSHYFHIHVLFFHNHLCQEVVRLVHTFSWLFVHCYIVVSADIPHEDQSLWTWDCIKTLAIFIAWWGTAVHARAEN